MLRGGRKGYKKYDYNKKDDSETYSKGRYDGNKKGKKYDDKKYSNNKYDKETDNPKYDYDKKDKKYDRKNDKKYDDRKDNGRPHGNMKHDSKYEGGKKDSRKKGNRNDNDDGKGSRAICYASGDPHYKTFDQHKYDFQGNCEYILTKPCDSDNFSVIVRNKQCNTYVTCTEQVTVLIPSEDLVIVLGRGNRGTRNRGIVLINDYKPPNNNDGIILQSTEVQLVRAGGQLHVILTNYDVNIFWDGRHRVEVKVSNKWQGKLCGLCGDYNLDRTDDFRTPDGELANTANSFGNSWLYNDSTSSMDCDGLPNPPKCPKSDENKAKDKCKILKGKEFKACHDKVDPDDYIADCEYDYCLCKEEDREECYCDSLATYAAACAAAGIALDWRSDELCCK